MGNCNHQLNSIIKSIIKSIRYIITIAVAIFTLHANAAVPASERDYLINLYNSTNGDNWTNTLLNNAAWDVNNPASDPCDNYWYGVVCNIGNNSIRQIQLGSNNLSGTLPSDLASALPNLEIFEVYSNNLTGDVPNLDGLTKLIEFSGYTNRFTGLVEFGNLPELVYFDVNNNEIAGEIPSLSGLPKLRTFAVDFNKLSGEIPSLSGLTSLERFNVDNNELSGEIPQLEHLTNLISFWANDNKLTGEIPLINTLSNLRSFNVGNNQLTGELPAIDNLNTLSSFRVGGNYLTGAVPAAPPILWPGLSSLCPNYLQRVDNTDWDTATGETPWHTQCLDAPTFTPKVQQIPTLSSWMLVVGLGLLSLLGVGIIRRRPF